MDTKPRLTAKQRVFVAKYCEHMNATQAAIEAGYSKKTARFTGSENLTKPNIQAHISETMENIEQAAGINKLRVVLEQKKIAFSNIGEFFETWTTRKEFEELTDEQKACISEVSYETRTELNEAGLKVKVEYVKFRLHDKLKALDAISKLMGYDRPMKIDVKTDDTALFENIDKFFDACRVLADTDQQQNQLRNIENNRTC